MSKGGRGVNGQEGTIRKFVAYFRVSTDKQGIAGLGMQAQEVAVARYVVGVGGTTIARFTEVESGKRDDRPELAAALALCKRERARLVIAKLDRLARSVRMISALMEGEVPFVACDFPEANELTLHIMAAVAQHERRTISERTKAALARSSKRLGAAGSANLAAWRDHGGDPMAGPRALLAKRDAAMRPVVEAGADLSLRALGEQLAAAGLKPRGGAERWSAEAVRQLRKRLGR